MSTTTGGQTDPVIPRQELNESAVYGRLIWKDLRELLPLLIAILCSVVICLSFTFWLTNSRYSHGTSLYVSAHTFIGFTAIVAGVFLFANENERRTLQMLRNMPISPAKVVIQKMMVGIMCALVMSVLTAGLTCLFVWFSAAAAPTRDDVLFGPGNTIVLPMCYFVVGAMAAMVTRSLYYGLLVASLIGIVTISIVEPTWVGSVTPVVSQWTYRWWVLLGLTAVTVLVLVGRANSWVEERAVLPRQATDWATTDSSRFIDRFGLRPLSVLVWQSFRQSRTPLACCAGLVISGWLICYWNLHSSGYDLETGARNLLLPFNTLFVMVAIVMLFSGSVFLTDQRNQSYRFFQQNVERPWQFWLARLLPWWCLAVLLAVTWKLLLFDTSKKIDLLAKGLSWGGYYGVSLEYVGLADVLLQITAQSIVVPLVGLLGLIGIGQLFSMFVRSAILATIFSFVFNIAFLLSVFYVVVAGESIGLFVVLPVVAVYLATLVRCRDWLSNRAGWVRFCFPLAIPICVCVMLGVGFVYHRAYEFDNVAVDFDRLPYSSASLNAVPDVVETLSYGTKAEREHTANLYRDAIELCDESAILGLAKPVADLPAEVRREYIDLNAESIDNIIQASQRRSCGVFLDSNPEVAIDERAVLLRLVLLDSYDKICNGQFESALESIWAYSRASERTNYVPGVGFDGIYSLLIHWADQPGQDPKLIQSAIDEVLGHGDSTHQSTLSQQLGQPAFNRKIFGIRGVEEALFSYRWNIEQLQSQRTEILGNEPVFRMFWWEAERQSKLLQRLYTNDFVKQVVAYSNYSRVQTPIDSRRLFLSLKLVEKYSVRPADMRLSSELFYRNDFHTIIDPWRRELALRRYTLLRMGLAAYRLKHDRYPDRLDKLSIYFPDGIPDTAAQEESAQWYPQGLPMSIVKTIPPTSETPPRNSNNSLQLVTEVIAPGTPVLAFMDRSYGRIPTPQLFWVCDSVDDVGRPIRAIEVNQFGPSRITYWGSVGLGSEHESWISIGLPPVD